MEIHPIARIITEKGVDSVDLSMFNDVQRREIYSQAANIFARLDKQDSAIICMERAGIPLPLEQLKKIAENKVLMGQHREAYELLLKAGQKDLAEFIKKNFL